MRYGKFRVTAELIREQANAVRAVMDACVIVRAEMLYHLGVFEFIGISPQFDDIEQGCEAPTYVWMITQAEPLGQITARAWRHFEGPLQPLHI